MEYADSDRAEIQAIIKNWAQAVENHDLDAVVMHRAQDIVMYDVPVVELNGMEEYKQSWRDFFAWLGEAGKFRFRNLHITAGSEVAFCYGIMGCEGTGQGAELTVRLTVGLEKIDGQWTVVHEHHSVASE